MSFFDIQSLSFMDISDYEGANIVWDLGYPVDESLYNRFDFIFNGSCLDNMFNPAGAMMSLTKMLRPQGRILHLEHATSFNSPYVMFPPGWFFDYYVQNNFADCKVYLGEFTGDGLYLGLWKLYSYDCEYYPNGAVPSTGLHYMVVTIAEKRVEGSLSERQPAQAQYRRNPKSLEEYNRNLKAMQTCPRPIFNIGAKRNPGKDEYINLGPICADLYGGTYPPLT